MEVLQPGLLTTVQDLGRVGFQHTGMVAAGAMDAFSLQVANCLVGNRRGAAGLEMTMTGPELKALEDLVIALCGADLGATVDGVPLPMWKSVVLERGSILRFRGSRRGVRAYLAVAGGICGEDVMGSKSTYLRAGIGGMHGRPLRRGDILERGDGPVHLSRSGRRLSADRIPRWGKRAEVRVVLGPQEEAFTDEGIRTFLTGEYQVTPQSDRMGIRLQGPRIEHRETADILSDAVAMGAVQVPADGQPIVLMADRQTTGGYAKIANVISVDLPKVAQLPPGGTVSFRQIDLPSAQELVIRQESFLKRLEAAGRSG
ncbi:MAG: biotin-dependent carboxyltransferase family protein [Planifilum sp.]